MELSEIKEISNLLFKIEEAFVESIVFDFANLPIKLKPDYILSSFFFIIDETVKCS